MTIFNGLSESEASFLTHIDDHHSSKSLEHSLGTKIAQYRLRDLSFRGYIGTNPNTGNPTLLTPGHIALNEYLAYKLVEAKEKKTERFRFWFPLVLSNCIALAALIISIIALAK